MGCVRAYRLPCLLLRDSRGLPQPQRDRACAAGSEAVAFLDRTVPLAELMAVELADKLDSPGFRMTWPNLADQSVDVHLRARGAAALRELGLNPADFLELVGLPMVMTTTATTDDDGEERTGSHSDYEIRQWDR